MPYADINKMYQLRIQGRDNIYPGVGMNKNFIFHNFKFHVCFTIIR